MGISRGASSKVPPLGVALRAMRQAFASLLAFIARGGGRGAALSAELLPALLAALLLPSLCYGLFQYLGHLLTTSTDP